MAKLHQLNAAIDVDLYVLPEPSEIVRKVPAPAVADLGKNLALPSGQMTVSD